MSIDRENSYVNRYTLVQVSQAPVEIAVSRHGVGDRFQLAAFIIEAITSADDGTAK